MPLVSLQALVPYYSSSPAFLNCLWPLFKPSYLPNASPSNSPSPAMFLKLHPSLLNCPWPHLKPLCLTIAPLRPSSTAPGLSPSIHVVLQLLPGLSPLPMAPLQARLPPFCTPRHFFTDPCFTLSLTIAHIWLSLTSPQRMAPFYDGPIFDGRTD